MYLGNTLKKYNFIGTHVDVLTYDKMLSIFDMWLASKNSRSYHVACVNVNCCVEGLLNKNIQSIFNNADIAGPDGMPFVYWLRIVLKMPCDRLYAPDIIHQVCKFSTIKNYSLFLYGSAPGVSEKMKNYLEKKYPGVNIKGTYSPPFRPMTDSEDHELCLLINKLSVDFLIVGLGSPKQDKWIHEHLNRIAGTVMIASGATFDFFGGAINQAPVWIQKSGFEWLFRLFQDPKRLWKRYIYYNALFIWNFLLQIAGLKKFE
jgi:N-acetylglucosaminyldiphosphoundecaprenol N-acetyl-beta-D-mannosaminyltransferase